MKVDVAKNDLLRLRFLVEEKHDQISNYPIMSAPPSDPTRQSCETDMNILRKLQRKLNLALVKVYGHDCNPRNLRSVCNAQAD